MTDWVLAVLALVACLYPVLPIRIGGGGGGYDAFLDRQGLLAPLGRGDGRACCCCCCSRPCRRTTGWVLPVVCLLFLGYGYYGGLLPQSWPVAHAGLDFGQIVDALYNSDSGFYGTPLDVAASYIVLFTIYGAVLDLSGAGRFFVELSVAAFRRSRSAAGRTAVASGFLLGTVSGSGTATDGQHRRGHLADPAPRRLPAGAGRRHAGRGRGRRDPLPADAGRGGVHHRRVPRASPTCTVLGWATIPTLLYYLGILLAVEIDARRFGVRAGRASTPARRGGCWPASATTSPR